MFPLKHWIPFVESQQLFDSLQEKIIIIDLATHMRHIRKIMRKTIRSIDCASEDTLAALTSSFADIMNAFCV